jgi:poly(3-hydroxyalkanoate) synthetase
LEKTNPTGDAVYMLYFDEGHPAFAINDPDNKGSTAWSATVLVPIGEWSHLAGTFDGETLKIFLMELKANPKRSKATSNRLPLLSE